MELLVSYKIPVTPLMKRILVKLTGGETYTISTHDMTGRLILGQMIIKRDCNGRRYYGNELFEILIPKTYWRDYRIKRFGPEHAGAFLDYHYEYFQSNLFSFIDSRLILRHEGDKRLRLAIRTAIGEFCARFGVEEEEYSAETFLKAYYRSRGQDETAVYQYIRKKTRNLSVSHLQNA